MNAQNHDCINCRTTVERPAEVRTPIDVRVDARLGEIEMRCEGNPATVATDCSNGCRLLLIQRINLRIPLYYEASVSACESETACAEDC